jgi:hypothetical protein
MTPFATQPIRSAYQPPINEGEPTACREGLAFSCTFSRGTWDAFNYNFNRGQYGKPELSVRQAPFRAQLGMWWLYFKWQWWRDAHDEAPATQAALAATFFLLALVGGVQLGATGEAQLVRPDASIVFSRRAVEPSARFFAADALRERVTRLASGAPLEGSYFAADASGQQMLVGMAPSQLSRSYPNVAWFVVVTQAADELAAPVASLGWYLLLTLALTAIAILIFALWFSMRLAAPPLEADMHLVQHPAVMHLGETDEPMLPETPEEEATRRRLA